MEMFIRWLLDITVGNKGQDNAEYAVMLAILLGIMAGVISMIESNANAVSPRSVALSK